MDHGTSSPFSIHGLSRESAYQKIDAEISNLDDRIRALRTLRNSLSPVSSIPPELLSKVFLYSCGLNESTGLLDECSDGEEFSPVADSRMRLIVTWVSQYWRQVAQGYPQLWSLIHADGEKCNLPPGYIFHCYRLSSGLGLCVDLCKPTDETLRASMLQLHRVQFLAVVFDSLHPTKPENFGRTPLSGSEWKQPAPMLQVLKLERGSITDRNLFAGVFPQLACLWIVRGRFEWDIPLLSSPALTTLRISSPMKRVTVPKLLHLLQSSPYLTDCHLGSCIQLSPGQVPGSGVLHRVRLLNLKKLSIDDHARYASELLLGLDLAESSTSISTSHNARSSRCVKKILTKFQEDTGRRWSTVNSIESLESPAVCDFSFSTSGTTTYRFTFYNPGRDTSWTGLYFITSASQNLPFDNLHSCSTDRLSIDAVILLGNLRHLNKLKLIKTSAVQPFIITLRKYSDNFEDIPGGAATPPKTMAFPALQDLTLVSMQSPSKYDGLLDVLTARKANGFGLRKLSFAKSQVSSQDTAQLALVVDLVTTDHW
ncbi:hypothetical protein BDN72DRAFT_964402 [Pluteus cervinus]|uniref:Uncharacterized protein n=1 Tax=Pluteus cervinus TaxID=181527 RepID=A0ACD3AA89_9AGAR|nr:hypothetical protein BDN72DRAFT_964402 [Pluteus cervinus]